MVRGAAFRISNRPEEALQELTRSITPNNSVLLSYHNRGILYGQIEKFDLAINNFDIALSLDSTNATLYRERGNVLALSGKLNRAELDFSQAILLAPDDSQNYLYRSVVFQKQGNQEAALADAMKYIELGGAVEPSYLNQLKKQHVPFAQRVTYRIHL